MAYLVHLLLTSSIGQTEVVSAKFVMKTDDDAFVRVDEILSSMERVNTTRGLLYGLINADSQPHRSPDSKWFISPEVNIFVIYLIFHNRYHPLLYFSGQQ